MYVGVMELNLALRDNHSLKDKRSVIKRLMHRCCNAFNVAAAEVEDHDLPDRATIGIVTVGNDRRHLQGLLSKVEDFVERQALAELLDAPKTVDVW